MKKILKYVLWFVLVVLLSPFWFLALFLLKNSVFPTWQAGTISDCIIAVANVVMAGASIYAAYEAGKWFRKKIHEKLWFSIEELSYDDYIDLDENLDKIDYITCQITGLFTPFEPDDLIDILYVENLDPLKLEIKNLIQDNAIILKNIMRRISKIKTLSRSSIQSLVHENNELTELIKNYKRDCHVFLLIIDSVASKESHEVRLKGSLRIYDYGIRINHIYSKISIKIKETIEISEKEMKKLIH